MDGDRITRALEQRRAGGASRGQLIEAAVRAIEAEDERFDWVGVYLLEGDQLLLHSYVGAPTEHDRIEVGVGVCGTAVAEERDLLVEDVREIDNYLACSPDTRSEAVVLIREPGSNAIVGQLDLDSDRVGGFGEEDRRELRKVADWLGGLFG